MIDHIEDRRGGYRVTATLAEDQVLTVTIHMIDRSQSTRFPTHIVLPLYSAKQLHGLVLMLRGMENKLIDKKWKEWKERKV